MVRDDGNKDSNETNLLNMVVQDAHYDDLKRMIFESLSDSFTKVNDYARTVLPP